MTIKLEDPERDQHERAGEHDLKLEIKEKLAAIVKPREVLFSLPHPRSLLPDYIEADKSRLPYFEVFKHSAGHSYRFFFISEFEARKYIAAVTDLGDTNLELKRHDKFPDNIGNKRGYDTYRTTLDEIDTAENVRTFLEKAPGRIAQFAKWIDSNESVAIHCRAENDLYRAELEEEGATNHRSQLVNLVLKTHRINDFKTSLESAARELKEGRGYNASVFINFFKNQPFTFDERNVYENLISQRDKRDIMAWVIEETGLTEDMIIKL